MAASLAVLRQFYVFSGIYSPFKQFVTSQMSIQINLLMQYLKHLTASFTYSCHFDQKITILQYWPHNSSFHLDKLTHTKHKVIIVQKECKTLLLKNIQKLPKISHERCQKSVLRNTNTLIWMGSGGISIECLVIALIGLSPVFLSPDHARLHFDTTSGTFWHQICFY